MPDDTGFAIAGLEAFHVAFRDEPGYWEEYRRDEVSARTERFEFRPGWRTVYARSVETALVRVRLADGAIGWGEANAPIGPEVCALILESLLLPMARGREFGHPVELWDLLYDALRGRGHSSGFYQDAMAGLDVGVWDALGRREGLPVAAMLGGEPRRSLPVYLSGIRRATLAERVEHINRWVEKGLRGAKIFLTGDVDAGAAELEGLQRGAPELEQWMVDTLWSCDRDSAREGKRVYGDLGVRFFECPLVPEDLEGHRELVAHPGAPIALGEHFHAHYQTAEWFREPRGLDVFQPDIGRTSLSDAMRQMADAKAAGIPTTPHMGAGTSVLQSATLQFATLAAPDYLQEYQAGLAGRGASLFDSGWRYADGAVALPDRPGLGVEVHEAELGRYVVRG
ncbi:MAG: mandelate racemase/muconate lactonizing enzyme family protein [Gemmatimonadetes bacterium]|nr:mandelate racemase/muconate lactonizing enzyme family protein [Gemmatimonadota bacterium]